MTTVPFQSASTRAELKPSPIEPSWIVSGNPVARATRLMRSADEFSSTVVWECTAGVFDWTYNSDETIHIVEGSIVLTDDGNPPKRLGPGNVVYFPKGAKVRWEVEGYVKKVAFFRSVVPNPLSKPYRLARRLKHLLKGTRQAEGAGIMGGGLAPATRSGLTEA